MSHTKIVMSSSPTDGSEGSLAPSAPRSGSRRTCQVPGCLADLGTGFYWSEFQLQHWLPRIGLPYLAGGHCTAAATVQAGACLSSCAQSAGRQANLTSWLTPILAPLQSTGCALTTRVCPSSCWGARACSSASASRCACLVVGSCLVRGAFFPPRPFILLALLSPRLTCCKSCAALGSQKCRHSVALRLAVKRWVDALSPAVLQVPCARGLRR